MILDSPSELIKNHTADRAREFFDAFDEFSPAMQQRAAADESGIDQGVGPVFREMITVASPSGVTATKPASMSTQELGDR